MKYVPDNEKKTVMEDLKPVYKAVNAEQGYERLLEFEEKRGRKYPLTAKSWLQNWDNLSTFFEYDGDATMNASFLQSFSLPYRLRQEES